VPTIYETADSRKISDGPDGKRMTLLFFVAGTQSEDDVYVLMLGQAPVVVGNMVRASLAADPLGGGKWKGSVEYSSRRNEGQAAGQEPGAIPPPEPPGESTPLNTSEEGGFNQATISFSTTGGTTHITQSIRTVHRIAAGGGANSAPDNEQAIGQTRESVEGCDVYSPKLELSITVERPNVTLAYVKTLRELTGRTNSQTFWAFAAGELLYLGAEGQGTSAGKWTVTHKFAAGVVMTDVAVSPNITVPTLYPWDYVWCAYGGGETGGELRQRPTAVYVEQVYYDANFAALEIGA
jgi:hypothetical protein